MQAQMWYTYLFIGRFMFINVDFDLDKNNDFDTFLWYFNKTQRTAISAYIF